LVLAEVRGARGVGEMFIQEQRKILTVLVAVGLFLFGASVAMNVLLLLRG
jgi:hypothetical protein